MQVSSRLMPTLPWAVPHRRWRARSRPRPAPHRRARAFYGAGGNAASVRDRGLCQPPEKRAVLPAICRCDRAAAGATSGRQPWGLRLPVPEPV